MTDFEGRNVESPIQEVGSDGPGARTLSLGPVPIADPAEWKVGSQRDPNGQASDSAVPYASPAVTAIQRSNEGLDVKRLIDYAALFVAPTSLVSGLMYWIGWSRSQAYWGYFGIDPALLKFSTTDYVIRAVSTAFTFLTMLILFAITMIALHRAFERRRNLLQPFQLQLIEWTLRGVGILFFSRIAIANLFPSQLGALDWAGWGDRGTLVGPTFGVLGVLLIAYSAHLHVSRHDMLHKPESIQLRRSRRILIGLAAGLVVLATFLAADRYATYKGIALAEGHAANPKRFHEAEIYSRANLQIAGSGLTAVPLDPGQDPNQESHRFRYSGLRLLRYSGGNYLFISIKDWRVFVLPESPGMRVEFVRE